MHNVLGISDLHLKQHGFKKVGSSATFIPYLLGNKPLAKKKDERNPFFIPLFHLNSERNIAPQLKRKSSDARSR